MKVNLLFGGKENILFTSSLIFILCHVRSGVAITRSFLSFKVESGVATQSIGLFLLFFTWCSCQPLCFNYGYIFLICGICSWFSNKHWVRGIWIFGFVCACMSTRNFKNVNKWWCLTLNICSQTDLHCSKTHLLMLEKCSRTPLLLLQSSFKTALFLLPELLQKAQFRFHPWVYYTQAILWTFRDNLHRFGREQDVLQCCSPHTISLLVCRCQ